MNTKSKRKPLFLSVTILGIIAMVVRCALYIFATDEKGLLAANHPLSAVLWVLTAAAAVLTLLPVRKLGGSGSYEASFPASRSAAAGCLLFAAGILVTVLRRTGSQTLLPLLCNALGLLSAAALVVTGICRLKGKRPHFLLGVLLCLYLMLYTISHYQLWSSHPQLQNAVFPLLGSILLLLCAYYQTAFAVDMGSRRMLIACGNLAVFACLASLPLSPDGLLYLTGTIWAGTGMCSREAAELPPAEEAAE